MDMSTNFRGMNVLKIDGSPIYRGGRTAPGTGELRNVADNSQILSSAANVLKKDQREMAGVRFYSNDDYLLDDEAEESSSDYKGRWPGEDVMGMPTGIRSSSPVAMHSRRRLVTSDLRLPSPGIRENIKSGTHSCPLAIPDKRPFSTFSSTASTTDPSSLDFRSSQKSSSSTELSEDKADIDDLDPDPFLSESSSSYLSSSEKDLALSLPAPSAAKRRNPPRRRISFPAESVLTAVVQDGDIPELLRILSDPHDRVDINQESHAGLTALHHGVLSNNLDAVKILLTHGAQVNVKDVHGFSPLHTASACGFLPIVSLLVLFGADVFALTIQSELPVDLAKDVGVVRLLMSEMTRHIHNELYVSSVVKDRFRHLASVCQRLLLIFIAYVFQIIVTIWRRYKRKAD